MSTQLTVNDDKRLCLAGEPLFYQVASDDFGFLKWPDTNVYHLFAALFDQANINDNCPHGEVLLPDGRSFGELVSCGFNPGPLFEPEITRLSKEHERVRRAAREPF